MTLNQERISVGEIASTRIVRFSFRSTATIALICISVSILARIVMGVDQPLWLDETWTGAIIDQPDVGRLIRQIYLDINAPAYYFLIYGWSKLFGLSDLSLRVPSLLFGAATPILIAVSEIGAVSKPARLTWAALLALWFPGILYSQDARCYAMLLFVCTAQTIVFLKLIDQPTLKLTAWWSALSALAILTHYDAGFLTLCEGAIYLGIHRERALKTWPAILCFLPAFCWLFYHLPRIAELARPDVAWYTILHLGDLPGIILFIVGGPTVILAFAAMGALAQLSWVRSSRRVANEIPAPTSALAVVGAATAASCLILIIGFLRPTFTIRYLTPVAPSAALGLVLAARPFVRRWAGSYPTLMAASLCGCLMITGQAAFVPRNYSFEAASQDLARDGVTQLAFTWDHPASPMLKPSQVVALGGFFFKRAHYPVKVLPVTLRPGDDASAKLIKNAQPKGSAILWLYDLNVHGTIARHSPPRIVQIDPTWRCRDYEQRPIGVLACYRQTS